MNSSNPSIDLTFGPMIDDRST